MAAVDSGQPPRPVHQRGLGQRVGQLGPGQDLKSLRQLGQLHPVAGLVVLQPQRHQRRPDLILGHVGVEAPQLVEHQRSRRREQRRFKQPAETIHG
jgi:hypothetical protein